MITDLISLQNPWWKGESDAEWEREVSEIRKTPYYYHRTWLTQLMLVPGDFHILRGPRQVGKTTLLKEWIYRLCRAEGQSPTSILYLSCESFTQFGELQETVVQWLSKKRGPTFVFLDEVSFVMEWQRAILWCFNAGLLKESCLVVTGSNARDLKESSERFPGRRGKGKDLEISPLLPPDYLKLEGFKKKDLTPSELLAIYFKVGGFPHALRDYFNHGSVSAETYQVYRNWIIGDASRFGLSGEFLKHLLFRIAQTLCSRITWSGLIENTPVRTHETALEYVEHLNDAFLCKILYCYDFEKSIPAINKSRKLYLIDPLLIYLAQGWKAGLDTFWPLVEDQVRDPFFRSKLLENTYALLASRHFPSTYFWYSARTKQEVDLVILDRGEPKLFDVKSGRRPQLHRRPIEFLSPDRIFSWPES